LCNSDFLILNIIESVEVPEEWASKLDIVLIASIESNSASIVKAVNSISLPGKVIESGVSEVNSHQGEFVFVITAHSVEVTVLSIAEEGRLGGEP